MFRGAKRKGFGGAQVLAELAASFAAWLELLAQAGERGVARASLFKLEGRNDLF